MANRGGVNLALVCRLSAGESRRERASCPIQAEQLCSRPNSWGKCKISISPLSLHTYVIR